MQRNRGPGLRVCEERGCSLILRVRPTLPGALEAGGAENAARARISETQRRPRTGQRPGASRRPALRKQRPLAAATTVDATNAATKANGSALGAREVTSRQAPGPIHGARGRGTAARGNPVALGTVIGSGPAVVTRVASLMAFRPHSPCAAVKPNTGAAPQAWPGPGCRKLPPALWARPAFPVRTSGRGALSPFILA
ncbi:hypothetical protein U0070_001927 [Myodes glareolus]|uniref:Uncharacterized protein n=1 Tax=Myodes glareolus TaxID=447135 RepID=A0AAW0HJW5_MYOGA